MTTIPCPLVGHAPAAATRVPNPVARQLAQVDLFAVLTPDEVGELAARVRRRRYRKGAVIFLAGDPGNSLFVIETGHVKIVLASPDGKELLLALRGPGEFFGDMALLDGEPRSADAVAAADCQLLIVPRADFLHLVETRPQLTVRLLAVLSRRLRRSGRQLQDATLPDVSARIASALLQLADDRSGTPSTGSGPETPETPETPVIPVTVDLSLTQADLAATIGVTRESVNKWLRYYARRGWIHWHQGRLTILQPDQLRQRAA